MNEIDVRDLSVNAENPRTLSEFMEGKLIESILVFPKMLEVRPIVVNEEDCVLGGNMRLSVLKKIAEMDEDLLEDYMLNQKKYRQMGREERGELLEFWRKYKEHPVVPVRRANELTKEEEREFLVKDNIHYGEDDMDILRHNFDREAYGDYTGNVAWNFYGYEDKINDKELEITKKFPERFKCGYVECQMTNAEYKVLCELFAKYIEENEGNSDGFLTYLLS